MKFSLLCLKRVAVFTARGLIGLCLLNMAGCSLLSPVKTPPKNNFTLNAGEETVGRSNHHGPTLLVSAPIASPGYDSTDMIYMQRPFQLNHYANNHWISPPADLIAPIMEQRLFNCGCFRAVVTPPFSGTTDLTLNTQLLNLRQEFIDGVSQERLTLSATLVDSASQQIIAQRHFEAVVPAFANNPYSGVIAANRALASVLQRLTAFVCHYGKYMPSDSL
jgi:cholesterol transport system auxiliary component